MRRWWDGKAETAAQASGSLGPKPGCAQWFKCPFHAGSPGPGGPSHDLLSAQETLESGW